MAEAASGVAGRAGGGGISCNAVSEGVSAARGKSIGSTDCGRDCSGSGRGPALGGPGTPDFTFHVFHVLLCVRRTSETTVRSPSVITPSRASISLLGFVGSGRWHCSREPSSAAGAQYTVRGGQLSRPSARPQCAPAMPYAYHTFGFDVDRRLTACCRLRSLGSCLFAFLRRLPTEAWQHPRVGAWCMKVRETMMVCDPARPVPIMYEHDRAAAAFRSMT